MRDMGPGQDEDPVTIGPGTCIFLILVLSDKALFLVEARSRQVPGAGNLRDLGTDQYQGQVTTRPAPCKFLIGPVTGSGPFLVEARSRQGPGAGKGVIWGMVTGQVEGPVTTGSVHCKLFIRARSW